MKDENKSYRNRKSCLFHIICSYFSLNLILKYLYFGPAAKVKFIGNDSLLLSSNEWQVNWADRYVQVAPLGVETYQVYTLTEEPHCELCGRTLIRGRDCWDFYRHVKLALCDGVFSLGYYYAQSKLDLQAEEDFLRQYIIALKKEGSYAEPIGKAMGLMMLNRYKILLESDLLIPVPSFANGYNQSKLLCDQIATFLNRSLGTNIQVLEPLSKIKDTKLHLLRTRPEREEAAIGMFTSNDNISMIRGKKITIVDDLLTTGITMNECIKILRNYGPLKMWVFVAGGNV